MEEEFNCHIKKFFEQLGSSKKMVLATSKDNRVTARTMSCIIIDNTVYFQTDKAFCKYEQISANPLVALCADNIQLEGVAAFAGHPLSADNSIFAANFEHSCKSSFNKYSHLKNEVLIAVSPIKITVWNYEGGEPYREFFDIQGKVYRKEFYIGK